MPVLVLGGFLCFFIAHSLFWYLGIFGSMGLTRVFICVIPLMALMMLKGFNLLTEEIIPARKNLDTIFKAAILIYIVIFPFTATHGSLNFDDDLKLSVDQKNAEEVVKFLRKEEPEFPRLAYQAPYLNVVLDIDPFDISKHKELNPESIKSLRSGELIIWDNHFALLDLQLRKEDLNQNPGFENIFNCRSFENGRTSEYSVYRKR